MGRPWLKQSERKEGVAGEVAGQVRGQGWGGETKESPGGHLET